MSHIHVPDGIIPVIWWVGGYVLAFGVLLILLKGIKRDEITKKIPLIGIVAAIMLLGMSVPLGIIPVHLSLAVLAGILIGPRLGFLAVFIVNLMLALLGHGGITLVGLNTLVIGSEVLLGYLLFSLFSKKLKVFLSSIIATSISLVISLTLMVLLIGFSVNFNEAIPHYHGNEGEEKSFEWHGFFHLEEGSYQLVLQEGEEETQNIVFLHHEEHHEEDHHHEEELAFHAIEEPLEITNNTINIRDKAGYILKADGNEKVFDTIVEEEGEYLVFLQHHPEEFNMQLLTEDGLSVPLVGEEIDDHHHGEVSETKYLFLTGWSALILIFIVSIAVEALGTAFIVSFFSKIRPDLLVNQVRRH
ncbi:energy-coupling factor ABC transporter permease [Alkaliphilus serpentinus]|uniref:Energy-coupling factor ABC transporter permease n=1 Tax=Alkaliphilus serpentinus TaxID=1482731 RepID=A0A833HL34_9FIRM|nr:energy-coupling factor ABC transporter permease [Alkaliphilus serpentinus]KAB3524940.1 energy-coupling factor ABC transporter permease [Alkaliphilus serpentinus]